MEMKCPHCGGDLPESSEPLESCPHCGKSFSEFDQTPPVGQPRLQRQRPLVVHPREQDATMTETILRALGILCECAAVIVAIIAVVGAVAAHSMLVLLWVAAGLCFNGLLMFAMSHALRYLRLIVNSLASMRTRPLGSEIDE